MYVVDSKSVPEKTDQIGNLAVEVGGLDRRIHSPI